MKNKKYIKSLIIRVLISIILFLGISIFVKISDKNLLLFKNNVYDKSFKFSKISSLYNKYFGDVLPPVKENVVSANKTINYKEVNTYKDGAVLTGVDAVYPYKSGIVVFTGEKEDYGNTIIIQGMDGVDIWYGNLSNTSVKIYDYVEGGNPLGEVIGDKLYLVFGKDNKYYKYEDYLSKY